MEPYIVHMNMHDLSDGEMLNNTHCFLSMFDPDNTRWLFNKGESLLSI